MNMYDQRNQQVETQYNAKRIHIYQQITSMLKDMNRQRLLKKVYAMWITGFLEKSLHSIALFSLGMRELPDAVVNPWNLVIQQDQQGLLLPIGTSIIQVFEDAGEELLILGNAGCGKTTLLLELARHLINSALEDDNFPMPVVFNLSSWAVKRDSLDVWLVEELKTKYQIPKRIASSWVKEDKILPLLDGLDEMKAVYRPKCIEAINQYRSKHVVPLVVCSRDEEYQVLRKRARLRLNRAVSVLPLTPLQVEEYLSFAGKQLHAVRIAFSKDTVLQELVTTPLVLNIVALAYQDRPIEELKKTRSSKAMRQQVFATYVERMLEHRGRHSHYTPEKAKSWLKWLADQMKKRNQIDFYIERMQPDWLPNSNLLSLYTTIVRKWIMGPIYGLYIGLFFGVVAGFILQSVFFGFIIGYMIGLIFGVAAGKHFELEINPAEKYTWSWVRVRKKVISIYPLAVGITCGLAYPAIFGAYPGLSSTLTGTIVGIGAWMLSCLQTGFTRRTLDKRDLISPNQGIWRSVRYAVFGIAGGLGIALIVLEYIGFVFGLVPGLIFGTFAWIVSGSFISFLTGGDAAIKHLVLRLLLWREGFAPLSYPSFLDYASDRILLRKIGGGYVFIHRELRDYLVSEKTTIEE